MRGAAYMKKARDFWPHCEAYINDEWQAVTKAEHIREYGSDRVVLHCGYGSHTDPLPGDYKLRYRSSR